MFFVSKVKRQIQKTPTLQVRHRVGPREVWAQFKNRTQLRQGEIDQRTCCVKFGAIKGLHDLPNRLTAPNSAYYW